MKNPNFKKFFLLVSLFVILNFILTTPLLAAEDTSLTNAFRNSAGIPMGEKVTPAYAVGAVINAALSIIGVIFVVLMVYGGYLWMTAGGNEEQITKAKKLVINSTIGLAITLASYTISYFVIKAITEAATGATGQPII